MAALASQAATLARGGVAHWRLKRRQEHLLQLLMVWGVLVLWGLQALALLCLVLVLPGTRCHNIMAVVVVGQGETAALYCCRGHNCSCLPCNVP